MPFIRRWFLLLILLSAALSVQAQQKNYLQQLLDIARKTAQPQTFPLFNPSNTASYNPSLFKTGKLPVQLSVVTASLNRIATEKPELLVIAIPAGPETIELELVPVELFMPNTKLLLGTPTGTIEAPLRRGVYYQGFIKNKPNSLVSLSIIDGELAGFVSDETGNRILSRLKQSPNSYLFYPDNSVANQKSFVCSTKDPGTALRGQDVRVANNVSCQVVSIYFEADYQMYLDNGSSVSTTTNFIMGVFNQVATIYNKENIAIRVAGIKIWTATDPYISATTTSEALSLFLSYQNANPPAVTSQLSHLLSTRGLGGGIAYVDVLCSPSVKYGVSANLSTSYADFPNYSWEVYVISHELGHNFGSPHTQSCSWAGGALDNCYPTEGGCPLGPAPVNGGTIMSYCHLTSYGVNLANGFGIQPGNLIRNRTASASCVPSAAGPPTSLAVKNIRATSVMVYWVSNSGSTSFTLQYRLTSSNTWITVGPFLGPQRIITDLSPNTAYVWRVTGECSSEYSAESAFTTGQPVYCTPLYTNNGCNFAIGLNSVTLNGVAMTTNSGCSPSYFTDYPTPVVNVSKAASNTFTVGFLGYNNPQHIAIWIDFNDNYEYEPSELVYATAQQYQTPVTSSFTIPESAPGGVTRRMRIRNQYYNPVTDPCATLGYGETEDYRVFIESNCGDQPVTPPLASSTTICSGTTAALSASGCTGGTIRWYDAATGGTVLATTSAWVTPALTASTTYYVSCTQGECESTRTTVTVTVRANPAAPIITASADSLACQAQSVTLVVTNCSGSVAWLPSGSGSSLVVNPTVPTTYTAICTTDGCSSSQSITVAPVATMFSLQSGNWNNPAVWSCNRVPNATDRLTIRSGHAVTLPASYSGSARSIALFGILRYQLNAKLLLGQ
ncbi:hypothetical protein HNV11_01935 [Spirosoma taeanense]|uniref:Peptidase M12B domain-containing protein n=1 Tax=Spirosoma taeanense TaxID=2735870 RepID=A0A6M5Y3B8_9BACT|nr:M12 family metallo-peptidase [Spirosoma taeanense]QJW88225.1 hypothetical protein HNV11_01935 [Spirosoma taeanense]